VYTIVRTDGCRGRAVEGWPPPTTRSGGHPPMSSTSAVTTCRSGTKSRAATSTQIPASCSPPGTRPWTRSAPATPPLHVARFGSKFDAQGVLAGSRDSARCIGYLTKYLVKDLGTCHTPETDGPYGPDKLLIRPVEGGQAGAGSTRDRSL